MFSHIPNLPCVSKPMHAFSFPGPWLASCIKEQWRSYSTYLAKYWTKTIRNISHKEKYFFSYGHKMFMVGYILNRLVRKLKPTIFVVRPQPLKKGLHQFKQYSFVGLANLYCLSYCNLFFNSTARIFGRETWVLNEPMLGVLEDNSSIINW